ncbi:SusD family protein [compost metagenome]
MYLFEEKWPEAVTQFESVISSGQYGLEVSVAKVFSPSGEFGKESLFESSFVSSEKYGWGNFPWGSQPESNIHVQLMGPRSDFYTKAPADSLLGGWGFNTPKKKLYDAFVAAGDSARRVNTIMSDVELKKAGGDWTAPNAYDYEGYFQRKYGTFQQQTGPEANELNYSTNFRLIRYADVLLMAAEAQYRNGNPGKSQQYLNMVRNRSKLASITPSGTDLFNAIVRERQLELAFEGFRFLDLVRWGMAPTELADEGFVAGKNEVLPIPINEVRTAGLVQNPKY